MALAADSCKDIYRQRHTIENLFAKLNHEANDAFYGAASDPDAID